MRAKFLAEQAAMSRGGGLDFVHAMTVYHDYRNNLCNDDRVKFDKLAYESKIMPMAVSVSNSPNYSYIPDQDHTRVTPLQQPTTDLRKPLI